MSQSRELPVDGNSCEMKLRSGEASFHRPFYHGPTGGLGFISQQPAPTGSQRLLKFQRSHPFSAPQSWGGIISFYRNFFSIYSKYIKMPLVGKSFCNLTLTALYIGKDMGKPAGLFARRTEKLIIVH